MPGRPSRTGTSHSIASASLRAIKNSTALSSPQRRFAAYAARFDGSERRFVQVHTIGRRLPTCLGPCSAASWLQMQAFDPTVATLGTLKCTVRVRSEWTYVWWQKHRHSAALSQHFWKRQQFNGPRSSDPSRTLMDAGTELASTMHHACTASSSR